MKMTCKCFLEEHIYSVRLPFTGLKVKLPTLTSFYYHRLVWSLYFQTGWGNFNLGQVGTIKFQPVWGFIFQNITDRSEVYTSTQAEVKNDHRLVGSLYFLPVWDNFEIKPWKLEFYTSNQSVIFWQIKHWPGRKYLLELYLPLINILNYIHNQ